MFSTYTWLQQLRYDDVHWNLIPISTCLSIYLNRYAAIYVSIIFIAWIFFETESSEEFNGFKNLSWIFKCRNGHLLKARIKEEDLNRSKLWHFAIVVSTEVRIESYKWTGMWIFLVQFFLLKKNVGGGGDRFKFSIFKCIAIFKHFIFSDIFEITIGIETWQAWCCHSSKGANVIWFLFLYKIYSLSIHLKSCLTFCLGVSSQVDPCHNENCVGWSRNSGTRALNLTCARPCECVCVCVCVRAAFLRNRS